MVQRSRAPVHRHLSAADERFGLRLGAGLVGALFAAVTFGLLLLLVRSGWAPLRTLDSDVAHAFRRVDTSHPELVRTAEVISRVLDPNVFRVVLALVAVLYLVRGERRHATWLLVTVFGGAGLGLALKVTVDRARPVLPDPVSTAPGMSFPSGHALNASIGCCLLLLLALQFLSRLGRIGAVAAAALLVGAVALACVVLGVHFVSDRYADGFSHSRALALQLCLSFIPLIIAAVGLAGAVHQQRVGQVIIQTVAGVLPGKDQGDMVEQAAQRTHDQGVTGGHLALWLGLLAAIVALTTAMGQIEGGANRIYGIDRDRPALQKYGCALLMAMTAGLLLQLGFVVIIAGDALGEALARAYGWGDTFQSLWAIDSWPVGVLLAWASFTVIIERAPRRRQPGYSWLAFGAGVSLVLWLSLTGLLALYVVKSGSFGSTYGPLRPAVVGEPVVGGIVSRRRIRRAARGGPRGASEPTSGDPLDAQPTAPSRQGAVESSAHGRHVLSALP